ncbi:MAG: translation elongation factor Ts [Phycisphaerales bacterium]|nr:MAG: translation elongation factor Ts [Phycisphaerales bacterium]
MANITAQMVKDLREKTDLPMMECKQALTECDGDLNKAMDWLRMKHKGKLEERADRATGEGRIGVYIDNAKKTGGIIELQCETAPVAKNELFIDLADAFAKKVAQGSEASPDPETIRKNLEMDALFTNVFGKLREAMNLGTCRRVEGAHLASYVHHDGKSGVLLALDAEPQSDMNIGGDLCMHSLFTQPIAIDRTGVPADQLETVRKQAKELAIAEGKPENITEKIVAGKVNAFYSERVLMEQLHVKSDDYGKAKIADVLKNASVNAVTDLVVLKVGG